MWAMIGLDEVMREAQGSTSLMLSASYRKASAEMETSLTVNLYLFLFSRSCYARGTSEYFRLPLPCRAMLCQCEKLFSRAFPPTTSHRHLRFFFIVVRRGFSQIIFYGMELSMTMTREQVVEW